jgi:hypothetical protein
VPAPNPVAVSFRATSTSTLSILGTSTGSKTEGKCQQHIPQFAAYSQLAKLGQEARQLRFFLQSNTQTCLFNKLGGRSGLQLVVMEYKMLFLVLTNQY